MPFRTFKRLLKACEEATDDTQRTVSVLAILTGKTEDEILNLPIAEYGRLAQIAQFIGTPPHNVPVRAEYTIGEFTLEPTLKLKNMTAGQFIDFQEYVKDEDKDDIGLTSWCITKKTRNAFTRTWNAGSTTATFLQSASVLKTTKNYHNEISKPQHLHLPHAAQVVGTPPCVHRPLSTRGL